MSVAGIKKISREAFGDSKGVISLGHVMSAVFGVAAIIWVSRILILTHGLPALDGITAFVIGPYSANKIATVAQSFSQNPVTPTAPAAVPTAPAPTPQQ
jgi:hypothetical protein